MSQYWQLCFCDLYFHVVNVLSIFQKPQLWRLVLFSRHKPKCGNKQQLYCSVACMHCGVFFSHGIETCTAPVQFFREREACLLTERGFYLHHHLDKHFLNMIQFFTLWSGFAASMKTCLCCHDDSLKKRQTTNHISLTRVEQKIAHTRESSRYSSSPSYYAKMPTVELN